MNFHKFSRYQYIKQINLNNFFDLLKSAYFLTFITNITFWGTRLLLDQYIGITEDPTEYYLFNKIVSYAQLATFLPLTSFLQAGLPKVIAFKRIKGNNSISSIINTCIIQLIFAILSFLFIYIFIPNNQLNIFFSSLMIFLGIVTFQASQATLRSFLMFRFSLLYSTFFPISLTILIYFFGKKSIGASISLSMSYILSSLIVFIIIYLNKKEKINFFLKRFLRISFDLGKPIYLTNLLMILILEGDKFLISFFPPKLTSPDYLYFRNTALVTLLFSSIITSAFYPKLLNKINNSEKDIKKYIINIERYMIYLSVLLSSLAIPCLFYINLFLKVQYIENISLLPIFIICSIPSGLINIYICVVISFNNEKKIIKNLILLLIVQIILQIIIYYYLPLIFSALFYLFYSIFYYQYIKAFALRNIQYN